ncbi:prolyl oligopeptidase family serine peptidase [Brevundimonas sp. 2R-24]|uniref:Prolyl oligopeptidase family serine peptidase n=1 Tax=Peiella sedimenti TaxID=3061083 RepID=A0ABT8SNN8_9CAUL|nr:prolyl oligopeptidase family serine peptidase [Caulobacteraceae bacterium XZ-24]
MTRTLLLAACSALTLSACASMSDADAGAAANAAAAAAAAAAAMAADQAATPPGMPADLSPAAVAAADPYIWLEDVRGARSMAFVEQQNARTAARLEQDPRYEQFRQEALAIFSAQDRIPTPELLGGMVYNFWQDAEHPRGVWRRTSEASYRSGNPQWETVLDIDALAQAEGKDLFYKGADCLAPDETRCLISLSEGGGDTVEVREFDTQAKAFVQGGFHLAPGKHRLDWESQDTILAAYAGEGSVLTESGYPFTVKRLRRGQTWDQGEVVYAGDQSDGGYGVYSTVYRDGEGRPLATIFSRPLDTYRQETWRLTETGPVKLNLPARLNVFGVIGDRLIFQNDEAWTLGGKTYAAGTIIAAPLSALEGAATDASRDFTVFAPTDRQGLDGVAVLEGSIVAVLYDNVRGGLVRFSRNGDRWMRTDLIPHDNISVHLVDSSRGSGTVLFSTEGLLTPPTLMGANVDTGQVQAIAQAPARFDASTHVVEQFEAVSSDGTRIPYFLARPRSMTLDGSTPTILYGYGGFQVSKPSIYVPEMGKIWLERGGAYVIANIRGGGEFGPRWHQDVLRERRQLAFDDYAAVAQDLIDRGVTSPDHLGIYGRSNGGVLTSVFVNQHPDLIDAAVIESPLIDMLRYHEMPAGASWIGEYGDPRVPGDAAFISRYSAYQNLRPDADLPEVYITTNTGDDRVHPGHARKYAARLAEQGHDYLLYEDTSGGHSYDADPRANARRWARHYVYLSQRLMD